MKLIKEIINIKENKSKYIAIVSFCVFFILFVLFRDNTTLMEWITHNITDKYKSIVGSISNIFIFSVAEVFVVAYILSCLYYVIKTIICAVKTKQNRLVYVFKRFLGGVVIAMATVCALTFLWGINYYALSITEKMDIHQQPISVEELSEVTTMFLHMLNDSAENVTRDEEGLFIADRDEIYEMSENLYDGIEVKYPFLMGIEVTPKKMVFSKYMSHTNYTGIFFPFTGEANINKDQPLCLLPSTIAHELAHVRGVAPEQDCNFIAILACEYSDNDIYIYSGRLLAFIYLSNALYTADSDYFYELYELLNEDVKADLAQNSAYWAQYNTPVADIADTVYDNFLQSYGQEDGVKSYGRVTDLLVAFYKN